MAYVKKLVMHGFKSFGQKTEILFDKEINTIVGPNGSGKSNIADSLCFVLGRLSAKSMRASQAKNLIFMGSKYVKPAKEAGVELVFDNSDRVFGFDRDEIILQRNVRRNGQSVYKINGEVKTRTEILEMLAQAGIDPYGFNLILQGQIQSIVRMHPDDRRKIIEEVAGISIYETKKEKALHELEKTEEKLKEITSTLRERTAYLRNLDKEREQALKFKDLELLIKRIKATVARKKADEKQKESSSILKSIEEKNAQRDKKQKAVERAESEINTASDKINQINKYIQQASGVEQRGLREQIGNLKAELEGFKVRREHLEHRKAETEKRIEELGKSIPALQEEIEGLKKESPLLAKKSQELKIKKEQLAQLQEERKKILTIKTELNALKERIKDKERNLGRVLAEIEHTLSSLEEYARSLNFKDEKSCMEAIEGLKKTLEEKRTRVNDINQRELHIERANSVCNSEIERCSKIKSQVEKIDVCPLCQSKISENHVKHVFKEADEIISKSKIEMQKSNHELDIAKNERRALLESLKDIDEKKSNYEMELPKHKLMAEKNDYIKKLNADEKSIKSEINLLEEKRKSLEIKALDAGKIDEKYDSLLLELEEISSRTEEDIDTSLLYKERDMEQIAGVIKRSKENLIEIENDIEEIESAITHKSEQLGKREQQEHELNAKFKKMFDERDALQQALQERNFERSEIEGEMRQIEEQTNYLRIGKAKIDAEHETFEAEFGEHGKVELVQASLPILQERLQKSQEAIMQIGSINMRALEVYEGMKKEYDAVQEKANTLEKEKIEVLSIIEEIDKKKKNSFMKEFRAINALFTENFSRLSAKGVAYLELDNQENIFEGGVSIVVRLAKGKYFDVTSLSGGEQTLVALSLLFAIQEHKPYHFYVFDEIDAALDKRNSERLASLLERYMKSGQYIVITHNDALIMNSNVLYGVSMHEGVSKILSLQMSKELGIGQAVENKG
jgi:chromosome segregation protein